ncbi:MAG: hypothetical protein VZS44_04915 [Bacilli bacterium]|nr:hypothetical protein [Bacilli bacterium]
MEDFNKYMEEFKSYSIEEKRKVAIDQLKLIASLTNTMCEKLNIKNDIIITKDIMEAEKENVSEEDFIEGIVVYANSIQNSLCDFIDKTTEILDNKLGE